MRLGLRLLPTGQRQESYTLDAPPLARTAIFERLEGSPMLVSNVPNLRCESGAFVLQTECMDKTIRVYASHKEMKVDEYRYGQGQPVHECMSAVAEITRAAYALKEPAPDVRRLQKNSYLSSTPTALST
jgi:hypothetical protein